MKKYLITLGSIIATLLMFAPIVTLIYWHFYHNDYWWLWLIVSILYDIYYYDNMEKDNYIDNTIKQIEEIEKQKGSLGTKEAKLESYKNICQNIVSKFK